MAPVTYYAINHTLRRVAMFAGGDERVSFALPDGWEIIELGTVLAGRIAMRAFWEASSRDKLVLLCPPGYEIILDIN